MVLGVIVSVLAFVLVVILLPKLYDYSIDDEGIKFFLFCRFVVYQIRIDRIKAASVVNFADTLWDKKGLFALRIGNRFQREVLVIEKSGFPQWLYLTPNAPQQALKLLKSMGK